MPKRVLTISCGIALALSAAAIAGCSPSTTTIAHTNSGIDTRNSQNPGDKTVDGVAATVNGIEITEQAVSDYISQYRLYSNAEDDDDWATLLDESSLDPAAMRELAIKQLAGDALLNAKADELGITVDESEIDEQVSTLRKASDAESDAAWKSLLETSGYTEERYRDDIRINILADKVADKDIPDIAEPSENDLQNLSRENPSAYTGKKVVSVVYSSGSAGKANVLRQDFADGAAEKEFRERAAKEVDDGNAIRVDDEGWSCFSDPSTYEADAIADTHAGDVVGFTDSDGSYRVVFIAEEYQADINGYPDLKAMPADIRAKLVDDCKAKAVSSAIADYIDNLLSEADLKINDMPVGLPYDVDMSLSNYGHETTAEEDAAAAQQLVDDHINALAQTAENGDATATSR